MEMVLEVIVVVLIVVVIITAMAPGFINRPEEREDPAELKKTTRKWTYDEVLVLAYILLYEEGGSPHFYNRFSRATGRTVSSIKRKARKLTYLSTDNASKMDREIVAYLLQKGAGSAKYEVIEAMGRLQPNIQLVNRDQPLP